jgi:hypothetical protein
MAIIHTTFECTEFNDLFDDDNEWIGTVKSFKMVTGPLTEVFSDCEFEVFHTPSEYSFYVKDADKHAMATPNGQAMIDFIFWFSAVYA